MNATFDFFPYTWFLNKDNTETTEIRVYGLTVAQETVCVRIDNFTPYVYIELPVTIQWNEGRAQALGNKLDELMGNAQPILTKRLVMKRKLYGAHLTDNRGCDTHRLFPFLLCTFSNVEDIRTLFFRTKNPVRVPLLGGEIVLKMHESDADPILQLTCCRNISTCGWVRFSGKPVDNIDDRLTLCDREYIVRWKDLHPHESSSVVRPKIMGFDIEVNSTNPSVMPKASNPGDKVFQISCVVARDGDKPENYRKYLLSLGDPNPQIVGSDIIIQTFPTEAALLVGFTKLVRTENPNLISGYNILCFDIPYMIERAKRNLCISDFDMLGFGITSHAKEKTIKWSSSAYKNQEFQFLDADGRVFVDLLPLVRRDFKMSSYKLKNIAEYFIGDTKDPLSVKGIFKCYRVGMQRDPQTGEFTHQARKAMAICGKYNVQDSVLVVKLMEKLQTWSGLSEMANICGVQMFALYTQGQQIKVYSQVYRYCMRENIVVEKDGYVVKDNERYVGALVFEPVKGVHKNVVSCDFSSMYPSTIIAYNIDYSTWVTDESIPDDKCNVMSWWDHQGCKHDERVIRYNELNEYIAAEQVEIKKLREKRDTFKQKRNRAIYEQYAAQIKARVEALAPHIAERAEAKKTIPKNVMCAERRFRFLKEPKGVLPTIIQNLLDARASIRGNDMKQIKAEINKLKENAKEGEDRAASEERIRELTSRLDVLDKRQLACKVSANSMYGIMGTRKGYIPFMPGAMCTTFKCRQNIEVAADAVQHRFGGNLIYGDTDSVYVTFDHLKTIQETWEHAEHVAKQITMLFPRPLSILFEDAVYPFYLIMTKKRYIYTTSDKDGNVSKKLGKKGVLLARRDNCKFIRDVYEQTTNLIAEGASQADVEYFVLNSINSLWNQWNHDRVNADGRLTSSKSDLFVVTKAVGDTNKLHAVPFINEKGVQKAKVGDYTVPLLSSDPDEREQQLAHKHATSDQEFYLLNLPAQVQLAERLRVRGQRVDVGTRLEYVVIDPENYNGKMYEKIECAEYFKRHRDILKIDFFYYLGSLVNPLDQLLSTAFPKLKDFTKEQHALRLNTRRKVLQQIDRLSRPQLIFSETV